MDLQNNLQIDIEHGRTPIAPVCMTCDEANLNITESTFSIFHDDFQFSIPRQQKNGIKFGQGEYLGRNVNIRLDDYDLSEGELPKALSFK